VLKNKKFVHSNALTVNLSPVLYCIPYCTSWQNATYITYK